MVFMCNPQRNVSLGQECLPATFTVHTEYDASSRIFMHVSLGSSSRVHTFNALIRHPLWELPEGQDSFLAVLSDQL